MTVQHPQRSSFSSCPSVQMQPVKARATVNKCALSFILGIPSFSGFEPRVSAPSPATTSPLKQKWTNPSSHHTIRKALCFSRSGSSQGDTIGATLVGTATPKKSSKLCVIEGCRSRAKHKKLCWRHGGSVKCKVADCDNRAKSKGVCWSHGGGSLCSVEKCETISVSRGFCWAHGGGKRCLRTNCSKPACARTGNYCPAHFKEMDAKNEYC